MGVVSGIFMEFEFGMNWAGFTHVAGSIDLVDINTLDDGSAVTINDTLDDGKRFII